MGPNKILASIFALAILIKLAFIIARPNLWMKFAGVLIENSARTTVIYLILAAIVGYYVFSRISILDAAAVMLFTSLLMGLSLAPYGKSLLKLGEEAMSTGLGKAWLPLLLWGLLALWILYAAFV